MGPLIPRVGDRVMPGCMGPFKIDKWRKGVL